VMRESYAALPSLRRLSTDGSNSRANSFSGPSRARHFDHPPPILGRVWWRCFRNPSPPCLPAKHTPRNRVNSRCTFSASEEGRARSGHIAEDRYD